MAESFLPVLQSLLGIALIPLFVWVIGESRTLTRRQITTTIAAGLALQLAIAVVFLKVPQASVIFDAATGMIGALQRAINAGTSLVFGYLAGAPAPFEVTRPQHSFVLAFQALPLILLMSALSRLLYYWGVLQRLVAAFAHLLQRTFGIGGPLGMASAANVLVGMVESPLLIRPYLREMGRGALFATMAVGMATIAGTVMVVYASLIAAQVPGAAGHLLAASLMNVPAALMLSRLAIPEGFEGGPATAHVAIEHAPRSSMDAIVQGTADGVRLLAAVVAMLVVMVALVALANEILGAISGFTGARLTLQQILGWLCAPVALLLGIPWSEAGTAGALIGQKIVLNEFLAYLDLAALDSTALSPRSRLIITYALCGFANLGSLGIMIGGLIAMVPERRADIVALGGRSLLVGALATLHSAAMVGALSW
ncbi:MAG TPA: nucleoside transporter C-terminal domain-containing protein [Hyphomicrobiaceae bacterium]|nr:nucleoside transporter C-terminal domain-containing protein [Hyphomicrobiaceae bacterium]